jgi:hypothetical protein
MSKNAKVHLWSRCLPHIGQCKGPHEIAARSQDLAMVLTGSKPKEKRETEAGSRCKTS